MRGRRSDCEYGNVLQASLGQNRVQAALGPRLSTAIPAGTVNKVCGSGLKTLALAAQAIRLGDAGGQGIAIVIERG